MLPWVLGTVGVAATSGWLCGMILSAAGLHRRSVFYVLAAMIIIGGTLGAATNISMTLAFTGVASVFYCMHSTWPRRHKIQ
jgi:hypothetical protein